MFHLGMSGSPGGSTVGGLTSELCVFWLKAEGEVFRQGAGEIVFEGKTNSWVFGLIV